MNLRFSRLKVYLNRVLYKKCKIIVHTLNRLFKARGMVPITQMLRANFLLTTSKVIVFKFIPHGSGVC